MQGRRGNAAVLQALSDVELSEDAASEVLASQGVESKGAGSKGGAEAAPPAPNRYASAASTTDKTLAPVLAKHQKSLAAGVELSLKSGKKLDHEWELDAFLKVWKKHSARYVKIEGLTGVPAKLIAAIHFRERGGSFDHYLAQGDPVGTVPVNIPIHKKFDDWDDAAVYALNVADKKKNQDALGITKATRDPAVLATYAEAYNGLGYHNRGKTSAYVYSGTDEYSGGKYVSDGVWSDTAVDAQIGVLTMMGAIDGVEGFDYSSAGSDKTKGGTSWADVLAGKALLKQGSSGAGVVEAQRLLKAQGHLKGEPDGDFGPGTKGAVRAFQKSAKLEIDGTIGAGTAGRLAKP